MTFKTFPGMNIDEKIEFIEGQRRDLEWLVQEARKIVESPMPRIRNGKVLCDVNGAPIPNKNFLKSAKRVLLACESDLRKVERMKTLWRDTR